MEHATCHVVLVEDNAGDVFLIREALRLEAPCEVTVLDDGDTAFRYFRDRAYGDTMPDLVVLDLNIPGRDGVEVLDLIRGTPELSEVAVAVVSSSPRDVLVTKAAQADCYITKPQDLDAFLAIGKDLLDCVRDQR
ncbi:MAG TPA: response regulator [Bryobacteraceae bacterium]|nr:response regulator [Bryobacteraceae bacterium]